MTGRTHVLTGILAGLIYIKTTNAPPVEVLSGAINACKLPDIDQKVHIFKHREFTHSFIIPFALYFNIQYFHEHNFKHILSGFLVGWLAHIFIDMFNGSGVALFYPFTPKRFHILDIRYGEKGEKYLYYFLLLMCAIVIIGINKVLDAISTFNFQPIIHQLEVFIQSIK